MSRIGLLSKEEFIHERIKNSFAIATMHTRISAEKYMNGIMNEPCCKYRMEEVERFIILGGTKYEYIDFNIVSIHDNEIKESITPMALPMITETLNRDLIMFGLL